MIEARTDAIEYRRNVLAHGGLSRRRDNYPGSCRAVSDEIAATPPEITALTVVIPRQIVPAPGQLTYP